MHPWERSLPRGCSPLNLCSAAAQCSYALHGAAYGSVTGTMSAGGGLGMGDTAAGKNRACVQSCVPALSEHLTGDTEDGLGMLLEDFVREVRPLLREVRLPLEYQLT